MANINSNFIIFLAFLSLLLMVVILAEPIGLLFGALFKDLSQAWVACNIILLVMWLASNYFVKNMPPWLSTWIKWLSFYTYGYDGCLQLQFMGGYIYQCVNGMFIDVCNYNRNGTFTGDDALQYFKIDSGVTLDFLALFFMFIVCRIATYVALRFIKHSDGRT